MLCDVISCHVSYAVSVMSYHIPFLISLFSWYLLHHGWSLYDAFYHVLDRRPCIQPRYQLFDQLIMYERVMRGNNTVDHHHNYQVLRMT